jgi:hypothetical protein
MGSGGMEIYQPEGVKLVTNVSGPDTLPIPNIATPP